MELADFEERREILLKEFGLGKLADIQGSLNLIQFQPLALLFLERR